MTCGLIDGLESEFFLKEKLNKHAGSAAEFPTAHLPVPLGLNIIRSGFKIPDQVQGQGVRPTGKAQHTWVCEHLPEACNAAIEP